VRVVAVSLNRGEVRLAGSRMVADGRPKPRVEVEAPWTEVGGRQAVHIAGLHRKGGSPGGPGSKRAALSFALNFE